MARTLARPRTLTADVYIKQPQCPRRAGGFYMSDEVISIEEVIAYSLEHFPGVIEDWN